MRTPTLQDKALTNILESVLRTVRPEEIILVEGLISKSAQRGRDSMLGWSVAPSDVLLLSPFLLQFIHSSSFIDFCKDVSKGALNTIAEHLGKKAVEKITDSHALKIDTKQLESLVDDFATKLELNGFDKQEVVLVSDSLKSVIVSHPEWVKRLVTT
jgi:hypothetical protein